MSGKVIQPDENLGVLVSGRGSNLQAIIDAVESGTLPARLQVVVSNVPDAFALERARRHGIPTEVVPHGDFRGKGRRRAFEEALAAALDRYGVGTVALAGFMRVLTPWFVARYPNRVVNVHPALLPSFPGLDAQQQALDHGAKVTGCTVHLVSEEVDAGPIIGQSAVRVHDDDTVDTLSQRILVEEHRLLPLCLRRLMEGRLVVDGRRVRVVGEEDE